MYADEVTDSMQHAIEETYRRREIQQKYNAEHGITPQTIKKEIREVLEISVSDKGGKGGRKMSRKETEAAIAKLTAEMREAARLLEFEHAAYLRDKIAKLKDTL